MLPEVDLSSRAIMSLDERDYYLRQGFTLRGTVRELVGFSVEEQLPEERSPLLQRG